MSNIFFDSDVSNNFGDLKTLQKILKPIYEIFEAKIWNEKQHYLRYDFNSNSLSSQFQ